MLEHLLILASTVTGYVLISTFAIEIKICAITAGIKKYRSIIKKNKKKHDKVVLFGKSKVNSIEILISL